MMGKISKKKLEELRKIRAYAIIAKGDTPQMVNEETFILPSQSNPERNYTVTHSQQWHCTCPDHKKTGLHCKHIQAIEMWLKLRHSMDDDILELKEQVEDVVCTECGSDNIIKHGTRKTKNGEKQRYLCKDCQSTFVISKIKGYKANAKLIALTMDLYFKGMSLRKISDTIEQFYEISVHHETIRRWINTFMGKINEYVSKLEPNVGDTWHIDEQKVRADGEWYYSWNILDEKTRFLIANEITEQRSIL
ncbi:MAG: IS1/IS1595 family N-terminal zinc-binding domain-containing protein, partial [Thermoplasmatota archaeon]